MSYPVLNLPINPRADTNWDKLPEELRQLICENVLMSSSLITTLSSPLLYMVQVGKFGENYSLQFDGKPVENALRTLLRRSTTVIDPEDMSTFHEIQIIGVITVEFPANSSLYTELSKLNSASQSIEIRELPYAGTPGTQRFRTSIQLSPIENEEDPSISKKIRSVLLKDPVMHYLWNVMAKGMQSKETLDKLKRTFDSVSWIMIPLYEKIILKTIQYWAQAYPQPLPCPTDTQFFKSDK